MAKKEIATSFLTLAGSGGAIDAFELYVAQDFIHHNQYFGGSRDTIMHAMAESHETSPNVSFDIKYVYEDGDNVITHSHVVKPDMEIAVVHILKFKDEKIVEMWDLGQIILVESPNENGMF